MTQVREGLRPVRPEWFSVNVVVSTVVAAGILCIGVAAALPSLVTLPEDLVDPAPWWLLTLFFVLAALSEVIYVPVRHADSRSWLSSRSS